MHLAAKVDQVDNKVDRVVELRSSRGAGSEARSFTNGHRDRRVYAPESQYTHSPMNQTTNIQTMPSELPEDDDMYTEPRDRESEPMHGAVQDEEYYDEEDAQLAVSLEEEHQDGGAFRAGIP